MISRTACRCCTHTHMSKTQQYVVFAANFFYLRFTWYVCVCVFFFVLLFVPVVPKRFLREGWLGPTFDSADDQWRELRESLPLLFAAAAAHGLLSLVVRKTCRRNAAEVILTRLCQCPVYAWHCCTAIDHPPNFLLCCCKFFIVSLRVMIWQKHCRTSRVW